MSTEEVAVTLTGDNADVNENSIDDVEIEIDDNGIEPGELPSANESGDKIVNVLEDILGEDGLQDDFQKELDDSAIKKAVTPNSKKAKATPKRKSGRKSKAVTKEKLETPEVKKKDKSDGENTPKPTESEPAPKVKAVKTVSSEKKVEKSHSPALKTDIKTEKTPKVKEKSATKVVSQSAEKTDSNSKTTTKSSVPKVSKTTTPKSTKSVKKVKKTVPLDEKPKKEIKIEQTPSDDVNIAEEKEALEKKVKELEKKVTVTEPEPEKNTKGKKEKPGKSTAERKRKASENSVKDVKVKKSKENVKVKAEKAHKKEDAQDELEVKDEMLSDHEGGDMQVIDDMDADHSDHDSHLSNASSFSHTFSHSPSFSGSLSGSFSGSLSLSSFSGSNTSLDSLGKERIKKKKKSKKKTADEEHDDIEAEHHAEFINSLLKGARYFIVKSNNHENVTLSKAKGVWATPPANERKLNDAYRHTTNVILVYSVKESGRFQGFARLASESRHDGIPVPWVLPPGFDRRILGGTFKMDWLNRKEVPFSECANLRNPWNENKEVKICRDGQELEPSVGEVLCRMFEDDLTVDLSRVARHLKQRKKLGDYFGNKREYQPRFRGGQHSSWRGGRGDFRGNFRGGDRGRFGGRGRGFFNRDGGRGRYGDRGHYGNSVRFHGSYNDDRNSRGGRNNRYGNDRQVERNAFSRSRSRSPPDYRRSDRESRDKKHKDKVKEFLKNDKSKFGVRKETLLHGSYSDYVREFQRQKEQRSSYYPSNYHHHGSSSRHQYDPKTAAEEFLRRTSSRR